MSATITIHYCTQCHWLLRATWMTQEILTSFAAEKPAVTLIPGEGGIFEVWVNDQCIWSRATEGGFPEITLLKQRIRDRIAPDKSLGHADRKISR